MRAQFVIEAFIHYAKISDCCVYFVFFLNLTPIIDRVRDMQTSQSVDVLKNARF